MSDKKEPNVFQKFVQSILTADQKKQIAEAHVKFNEQPPAAPATPAATTAPVKLESEVKIAGTETVLVIAGDPATATAEAPVMVVDKATGSPAPDGEHKLEDGSTITVTAGGITSFKPAEVAPPVDMAQAVTQAATAFKAEFKTELSATIKFAEEISTLKLELAEAKQEITDMQKLNKTFTAIFHAADITPVDDKPATTTPTKSWDEMTGQEQVEFKRSQGK